MQSSVDNEKSFAKNLLSSMTEIGGNLFSTLETHCRMAVDGHKTVSMDNSLLQDQCKILCERLNNTVAMLAASDAKSTLHGSDYKVVSRLNLLISKFSSVFWVLFFILTLGYTMFLSSLLIK